MYIWWILLAVWVVGFVGFLIAIYREAPKHAAKVGITHYVIAAIWPFWGAWYVGLVIVDWVKGKIK